MRLRAGLQRGDTIIEVMFAIVVFSFVSVMGIMTMNKGIDSGQRSLEITLVRQQIDAQAEALRYIREERVVSQAEATAWDTIKANHHQERASEFRVTDDQCSLSGSEYSPFVLNARSASLWPGDPIISASDSSSFPPFAQVRYEDDGSVEGAYGIWVEAVPSSTTVSSPFIDFHIRACWHGPGSSVPITIGTIVRLYDPVQS